MSWVAWVGAMAVAAGTASGDQRGTVAPLAGEEPIVDVEPAPSEPPPPDEPPPSEQTPPPSDQTPPPSDQTPPPTRNTPGNTPARAPGGSAPAAPSAPRDEPPAPARARLRGRVLTFGEREPIAGARLIFSGDREPVESDDGGSFSVRLPPGKHKIIVRAQGFEDLSSDIVLAPGQDLELEYRLEADLDGRKYRTVVKAEHEIAVSSTTLRDAELREVPGTGGDPLRVVQSLPGASQLAGFLPYVVVRGAAPGNTGYYLDGARVPILFHVALGPSVIHPYFIDQVDFYPTGAPVRLGRFSSGIIEASTRPSRRDRVHGDLEIRLTDAGGLLEIPVDRPILSGCREKKHRHLRCPKGFARGALTLAGRYSYTSAVLTAVQSVARIRFWDYQARFDHDIGQRSSLTMFAYGAYDDLGQKATVDENGERQPAQTFVRFLFHRIDTRIRQQLPGGGRAMYTVVLGLDQSGFGVAGDVSQHEWRVAPRVDFRLPIRENLAVGFGYDQEIQFFRVPANFGEEGNIEDLALLFSERNVFASGLYVDLEYRKNGFEMRPGLRADFYAQHGESPYLAGARGVSYAAGFDPRLTMRERVGQRWWLRQAVGMYHQPPSFPIPLPGIESFGFERGLQRNTQLSLGYEVAIIRDRLQLHQDAYGGRLNNLQDYELAGATGDTDVGELEDVLTSVNGWAYGLETMLRLDPTMRVFGWIAYTLSRSTREYPGAGSAPSNWDQRHILNVVLGYRLGQKWNFGGRVHFHTGRPWTSPQVGEEFEDALRTRRNNARLPPFFQLDLRVERIWRWPNWQLSASADITNSTYSREVFACTPAQNGVEDPNGMAMQAAAASRGLAACTPQGFRYIVPSIGVRARW